MSNAAATIPAKRNVVFRTTKTSKIPSLDDTKDKVKPGPKARKRSPKRNADVLVVNHRGDSNQCHFEDEETWMGKTKTVLESGLRKLDTVSTRGTQHRHGVKPVDIKVLPGESKKPTIKIMNVQKYEEIMEERKQILKENESYAERVADLEVEITRVLIEFGQLYEDNEKLRRKMDTGKDPLLEPYSRVFEDRKILREAEGGYKKRIVRLQQEIIDKQNECDKFQDEAKKLRDKIRPTTMAEEKEKRLKEVKVQTQLKKLKTENETLKSAIKDLESINNKAELKKLKIENETLTNASKKLKHSSKPLNEAKTPTSNKNDRSKALIPKGTKVNKDLLEERPYYFDYELLLPDSQVYD